MSTMGAFDVMRTPWALAFTYVPSEMSCDPSHQSAPDPEQDEMSRLPYPDDSVRVPTTRARSAPLDALTSARDSGPPAVPRKQSGPCTLSTTDVRKPVSSIAKAFGISKVEFKRSETFLNAAHVEAFGLFNNTVSLDRKQAEHWLTTARITAEQVKEGRGWCYEEDQVMPVRMVLIHLTRQLGIIRNQHCLTSTGRTVVASLSPLYGRSDTNVKIVSDLECRIDARTRDPVAFEIEKKRIFVAERELDYIDTFMSEQGVMRLQPNISQQQPVEFTWMRSTGEIVSCKDGATVRAAAEKMLCQVFGQMLCYRTRRVILMTWEKMIVLQMELDHDNGTRSISISPMIRRQDGDHNVNNMDEAGSLVTEDCRICFRKTRDSPSHALKPTYLSTLLALSLVPCDLSPPDFFPPDSLTKIDRTKTWGSAIPVGFEVDPSAPPMPELPTNPNLRPLGAPSEQRTGRPSRGRSGGRGGRTPPGPQDPSESGAQPSSTRTNQHPAPAALSFAADEVDERVAISLDDVSAQPQPTVTPSLQQPLWSPPEHRIHLPSHGLYLDPRDICFRGVDLSKTGEMTPNGTELLLCEDTTDPMLSTSRPNGTIVFEKDCIGSGRLGDVLGGKARFAAPSPSSESPAQSKRRRIHSSQGQRIPATDVAVKLVCPDKYRDYGDYEGFSEEELLQIFVNEASIYLHAAKSQQGKTIAKCYGVFRVPLVLRWIDKPYFCAPREGETPEYNLYALVLERLGESISTEDRFLASGVDPNEVKRLYNEFHQCGLVHIDISLRHILRAPMRRSQVRKSGKKSKKQRPAEFKYRICDLETCGAPTSDYTFEDELKVLDYALRGRGW